MIPPYAQALTTFFAVGMIALSVAIVGTLIYRGISGKWLPDVLAPVFDRYGLLITAVLPVLAVPLSLWYSEVVGFTPCPLCWFGRTMMYPLAIILAIAAWRKDKGVYVYALPLAVIGFLITSYQHLMQVGVVGGGLCEAFGGECAKRYVFEFGFVTLPYFGAVVFAVIIILLLALRARSRFL
jgi:disulfide bond formation protein DsbB